MALPAGVTSGAASIKAPVSFGGTPAKVYLEVVANVALNHIATGTPIANFIDVRTPGEGQVATVTLPHTDQAGFQDESGAPVINWSYAALIRYELDGQLIHIPTKHFQLLTGQTNIDLALIPVGEPTEIILGNVAFVSSVNGRSGAVTLTKTDVGLANVDNTSDANKPISTAAQSALDTKADATATASALALKAPIASPTFTGTVGGVTKSMVGLGNVDNTSDANKPVSTATNTALGLKAPIASPTFTGTVGGVTKSMVGLGSVDNTADSAKPISTAQQAALDLKAPIASPTFTGTVGGVTKAHVGLGNVDNTSDANKPVSTAQQSALDLKAPIANPTFTGTVGGVTKTHVGLGNVDNTSDANKPISTATQTALDGKENMLHTLNVRTATPYNIATTDDIIIANLGTAIAFNLPDPGTAGITGKEYMVKNIGAGTLTVASLGTSKTIDGAANFTLAQYARARVYSNGTQWFRID